MKIKQTIQNIAVVVGILLLPVVAALPSSPSMAASCGGVETALISCSQGGGDKPENTGLWGILLMAIGILTAGVGVLALAGIVYGAILWTSAGGSPEQIKKARTVFTNVVIGVVAFGGMYVLLNFLVPGGVFN
jgi:hypothetical protein